jgi:hypothetical protein
MKGLDHCFGEDDADVCTGWDDEGLLIGDPFFQDGQLCTSVAARLSCSHIFGFDIVVLIIDAFILMLFLKQEVH